MDLEVYRRLVGASGNAMNRAIKQQSDMVIEATWNRDPHAFRGYIYDYFSDDSVGTLRELSPWESKSKVPVDVKFTVAQKGTLSKDQVEYHLQFRPSHKCPLDYYRADYDYRYGMEYPIGLYIDLPDEKGVYRKWLICSDSRDPEFVRYSILPCNYTFRWVYNGIIYTMDGVARLRNSYNSGVWTDYLTTTVENQDQMWLPLNPVSTTIFYNQRFLISPPVPNPTAWSVTKVETLHPIGIYKVVVAQDLFDEHRDLVDLEHNLLIADYYKSEATPEFSVPAQQMALSHMSYSIETSGKSGQLKVGGSPRTFSLAIWDQYRKQVDPSTIDGFPEEVVWSFSSDGEDVSNQVEVVEQEAYSVTIRVQDEALLDTAIMITATGQMQMEDDPVVISASTKVEVIGL